MALMVVGGITFPNPTKYIVTRADIDSPNSTRSETGYLFRERIRSGVYNVQASFLVDKATLKLIADAVAPEEFTAVFFDPNSVSTATANMYASDRVAELVEYIDETHPEDSYWEISFTLIEY